MPSTAAAPTAFGDGAWVLKVDREWDGMSGNIQFPTDTFSEGDYKAVAQPSSYAVVVSKSGTAVSIGSTPFMGSRTSTASAESITFELSQGTTGGGRFVVWKGSDSLQAELTLYGSGRPIVKSERGWLAPK
jgi:hypothetical protein